MKTWLVVVRDLSDGDHEFEVEAENIGQAMTKALEKGKKQRIRKPWILSVLLVPKRDA